MELSGCKMSSIGSVAGHLITSVVLALMIGFAGATVPAAGEGGTTRGIGPLPLRWIADIPLPGRTNRFDYQSYDPQTHLLFIAHLGDSAVTVINADSRQVVANITGISQVHGVLAIPSLARVYATATGRNEVAVLDERDLRVTAVIPAGAYPDGMAYAPRVHKLYVSDEIGRTETVIDTDTERRIATIPLGGEAGNSRYDPVSRHIFVNVQTLNQLVEIDPATDKIVGRYPLPGAKHNHGLLIEPQERLAFAACEGNAKLLAVDMRTMRVLAAYSIGEDPDVLAFDPGLHLLYVASESGVVSVFREHRQSLEKIGEGFLAEGAHTVAVDAQTHRVYFPLPDVHGRPTLRVMGPAIAMDR